MLAAISLRLTNMLIELVYFHFPFVFFFFFDLFHSGTARTKFCYTYLHLFVLPGPGPFQEELKLGRSRNCDRKKLFEWTEPPKIGLAHFSGVSTWQRPLLFVTTAQQPQKSPAANAPELGVRVLPGCESKPNG